jgi:hypothetical protein
LLYQTDVGKSEEPALTRQSPRHLSAAALLLGLLVSGCVQATGQTAGPGTPGWTGRSVIVGNKSTITGDAAATENQQKWPLGRGR